MEAIEEAGDAVESVDLLGGRKVGVSGQEAYAESIRLPPSVIGIAEGRLDDRGGVDGRG